MGGPWRTHSCVPRPHSWGREGSGVRGGRWGRRAVQRSHECERGTHECVRHNHNHIYIYKYIYIYIYKYNYSYIQNHIQNHIHSHYYLNQKRHRLVV